MSYRPSVLSHRLFLFVSDWDKQRSILRCCETTEARALLCAQLAIFILYVLLTFDLKKRYVSHTYYCS